MIRILKIEWDKLRSYRAFWVMIILYLFILSAIIFGLPALLDYVASKTEGAAQVKVFKSLVFNFPDIWQNISFVASFRAFIKIILAIIVVIVITNEFTFHTIRANVMNGMSRNEFLIGKMELVLLFSLLSTLIIFLSGLYLGLTNSSYISVSKIFSKMSFLFAYFLEIFTYLTFALLIGFLIKKTGFSIITLLLYMIIEPIIQYYVPDKFDKFLPLNAMNHLIWSPNTSLIKVKTPEFQMDFQEYVSLADTGICVLYAVIFVGIMYLLMRRSDL